MNENGAAAEFVVAPADVFTAAPRRVPLADAAALPAGALTAWQALFEAGADTAGRYCLIDMHVPPGGPRPHRHDCEESFTVLEGDIETTLARTWA